ncbi:hypothetical protein QJS04_geneDACA020894 [Acorus gramineus]|uniref:Translocon-associated protein subunit beta n=1 Tax=Acorus gramineus TaxID=55184 RepID=A0AAV9B6E2_ACOGR|nr:hypothetical protein QJS04_geneDACA020894 [Acorus gramineus]
MAVLKHLLASLLLFLLASSSTMAISDAPFMVSHKKVSVTRLKSGADQVSVAINIYNEGSATAYDVSLTDDSWSKDVFDVVSGTTSNTWERLDAGSIVSHTFVLESKVKGMFYGAPALIKFRVPTKAALQEAYSTPILPLDILADRAPEKKLEFKLLAKYGPLLSVLSFIGVFIHLILSPSKSSAAKASKKKR